MKKLALIGDCDTALLKKATLFFTTSRGEDVQIFLSTYGGCIYSAFGILDLMRAHDKEVDVVCVGPVFSAGMVILAGGTKRRALPLTTFLIHYGTSIIEGLGEKRQEDKAFKVYKDILDKSSTVQRRVVSQWLNSETYMDVRRALLSGLIDEIIEEPPNE